MNNALVWLGNELRVADNPALYNASNSNHVVAVTGVCPHQWRNKNRWGDAKINFMLAGIKQLANDLAKRNIALEVVECDDYSQLAKHLVLLAEKHQCQSIHANQAVEFYERQFEGNLENLCYRQNLPLHWHWSATIVHPKHLLKTDGTLYKVFTPFKQRWLRYLSEQGFSCLRAPQKQAPGRVVELPNLNADRHPLWPAGEHVAQQRLHQFIDTAIDAYHDTRDLPATPGTSKLSPYLAAGMVSANQCLSALLADSPYGLWELPKGKNTWLNEIIWREFYRYQLYQLPQLSRDQSYQAEKTPGLNNHDQFDAWCRGETGIPLIDAGMRQLQQQAWMHNRVRMVCAMFLSKQLMIDWRWGEQFFSRHLIDIDQAANNGGWQWSAGTGTDAAPYFRVFNPIRQAERFDPSGHYIKSFVPELAQLTPKDLSKPWGKPGAEGYSPAPMIDLNAARQRYLDARKPQQNLAL